MELRRNDIGCGASVLINYPFCALSYDIDATYEVPSIMKEAINAVGDKFGLPNGWVNDDFKRTASYTPRIAVYSDYYETFSGVLQIRTVRTEYLVAISWFREDSIRKIFLISLEFCASSRWLKSP